MKNNIDFYERQSQKTWWLYVLLIGINIPFIYGIIWQVVLGNTFGNNPMSNTGLIFATVVILIFSILTLFSKLETIINNEGIYVRYFPFNLQYKFYSWNEISKAYVREYAPVREFGGTGIRITMNKGKAYIVSGRYGLQLEIDYRKKVFIGTQYPDEVEKILKNVDSEKCETNNNT